ncbi:hypothetical protein H0H93_009293 [Arthromyces matolae]|nr:hypothetical protein H0H93_009293 [Arthromyces matolae]
MKPSVLPYILAACVLVSQLSGVDASPLPQSLHIRRGLSNLEARASNNPFIKDGHESLPAGSQRKEDHMMPSGAATNKPVHATEAPVAQVRNHSSHSLGATSARSSTTESDKEDEDALYMGTRNRGIHNGFKGSSDSDSDSLKGLHPPGKALATRPNAHGVPPTLSTSSLADYFDETPQPPAGGVDLPSLASSGVLPDYQKKPDTQDRRRGSHASQGTPTQEN